MRKLLPYSLPLLFGVLFVSTAHTNWLWVSPVLIFLAGPLTTRLGEFNTGELVVEWAFFHHSRLMARFKTLNGIFFGLLNAWSFWFLATEPLPTWRLAVFVYALIILNSNFSLSLAHDLMHAHRRSDRWLSNVLMLQNGFFYLEADHLYIHHRHVGTVNDPATARLGESIYRYLYRSLRGRMQMLFGGSSSLPTEKYQTIRRSVRLKLLACLLYVFAGALLSGQVLIWIISQYVFVILIYESVTYIQHYAMQRQKSGSQYEPTQLHHAWNSFYRLNTYLYFMMPVHSLHHVDNPNLIDSRQFAGPRMPLHFSRMLIMAYQPSRWFTLMNKRSLPFRQNYLSTFQ